MDARETQPLPDRVRARLRDAASPALYGSRLHHHHPWSDLLALPIAFALALPFGATTLGRLLGQLVQLQFHELGHAIPAWLSSRAALPLPFGVTFFREEQSAFTGLCMLFLLGLFTEGALRERRYGGALLGGAMLCAFACLTLLVSAERSRLFVLAGGFCGELALPTLALAAFYVPLPDRLRWDFFRYLALLPSAAAWLEAEQSWRAIAAGQQQLPMSSLLLGDGSSDFARLIGDYGVSSTVIIGLGSGLTKVTAILLFATYATHAWRAWRRLRGAPSGAAS